MLVHLTLKAKLVVTPEAAEQLKFTMVEFNKACNILSELAYQQDLHRKYDIHHAGYSLIRQETQLPAQHVINAIAKVSAAYIRDDSKWHKFKPYSSVRFDARSMKVGQDCYTAALTICPKGRVTGQLQMSRSMRQRLNKAKVGSAELIIRNDEFYLHFSVEEPTDDPVSPQGSLGVDLGVNRIAVDSDRRFYDSKSIRHRKKNHKRTRRSLQANGSKSAKQALKRVSGREERFVRDINHQISKQIVAHAKANNQRIVLEDLAGIRETGKAKVVHDWSFDQLRQFIAYKAEKAGIEVVFVDPRYSSQMCYRCLHLGQRFTQSDFYCPNCGLQINADLNGSKSIALRHDLIAMGRYFCAYDPQQVNHVTRPKAVRSPKPEFRGVPTKSGTASPRL
jgi:putative transposase